VAGDIKVTHTGDFDTASVKIAASKAGYPTAAQVRSITSTSVTEVATGVFGVLMNSRVGTTPVLLNLNVGETAYISWFGYSETGGTGNEQTVKGETLITRTAGSFAPKAKIVATRSGTTVSITLTVSDLRLKATAVEKAMREGDDPDTGFSAWTGGSGTIGSSTTLVRTWDVEVEDGKDSEFRWQVLYTDENGNLAKPLGDTIALSNLRETTKTLFLSFVNFRPIAGYSDFQTNLDSGLLSNMGPASSGTKHLIGSLELPVGVILTRTGLHGFRNSVGDTVNYNIIKIPFNGSPTALFSLTNHSTTGWEVIEKLAIGEVVAADAHYVMQAFLTEASARNNATVRGIEYEYDVDAYVKTY
jgi:hypothetical protein